MRIRGSLAIGPIVAIGACAVAVAGVAACEKKPSRSSAAPSIDAGARATELPPRKGRPAPPLPDPLPGARRDAPWLKDVLAGAAGDLDGDGRVEIVVVDATELRVLTAEGDLVASAPAASGIQSLVVDDGDGDGTREIVSAWGRTPERRDGQARVAFHRLKGGALIEEGVLSPVTQRHDVVATLALSPGLLVAYFESKYQVKTVRLLRGERGFTLDDVATIRMATAWARGDVDGDRAPDLIVGRVYGDDTEADGDAFLLRPDGTRVQIPTTRGTRSVALIDLDGDGRSEIFLGDGWHKNYGRHARGLLTWARWSGTAFTSETIEDTEGQSSLAEIFAADVDGDGSPEIVTRGDHYVRIFRRAGDAWNAVTVAGKSRDVFAAPLDGTPGDELVILGERPEIVSLRGVAFAPVSRSPLPEPPR